MRENNQQAERKKEEEEANKTDEELKDIEPEYLLNPMDFEIFINPRILAESVAQEH